MRLYTSSSSRRSRSGPSCLPQTSVLQRQTLPNPTPSNPDSKYKPNLTLDSPSWLSQRSLRNPSPSASGICSFSVMTIFHLSIQLCDVPGCCVECPASRSCVCKGARQITPELLRAVTVGSSWSGRIAAAMSHHTPTSLRKRTPAPAHMQCSSNTNSSTL